MKQKMKNKKIYIRLLAVIMLFVMVISMPLQVYAQEVPDASTIEVETQDVYGRLPVYLMDNGNLVSMDVYVQGDKLYVKASSFAKKLGYICGYTDSSVQFLQPANEIGEAYKWTLLCNFEIGSQEVWLSDGKEVNYYTAPYETIRNDKGEWIPLQFALKIMGRELCINNGFIVVSKAHESIATAVNNVAGTHSEMFSVMIETNRVLNQAGYETETSPLLTMALDAESNKCDWLYEVVNKTGNQMPQNSTEGIDELATYLVSNFGPENMVMYETYYELIQMYLCQDILLGGQDVLLGALENGADAEALQMQGLNIIQNAANNMAEANPSTATYNQAYIRTYADLAGYDVINQTLGEETVYDEFLATMITYNGDPSEVISESIEYGASFIPVVGDYSFAFSYAYTNMHCMKNMFAENAYAGERFDKYLNSHTHYATNPELINAIEERIDNYAEYQTRIMQETTEEMLEGVISDKMDEVVEETITELIPGADFLFKILNFISGVQDPFGVKEYMETIDEIYSNELSADNSNYRYAKTFANEIGNYAVAEHDADTAYLYYRTDYIANMYYQRALLNPNASQYMTIDNIVSVLAKLCVLMEEEQYHLGTLRVGIEYGLKPEDNEGYNSTYDDSKLIPMVESVNMSVGNTNANMNACGFAAATGDYAFYVDATNGYSLYMESLDAEGEATQIDSGWAHWLNTYEDEENQYLFYIDEELDISKYDVTQGTTSLVSSGNYHKMMIAYGYIFVMEGSSLYRIDLIDANTYGEKVMIIADVGSCLAFDEGSIYYTDANDNLLEADLEGVTQKEFGIQTESFDISNGNIYYANRADNDKIYVLNIAADVSAQLSDVEDAYCLSYYKGMVYYKVDDDMRSGLLYAAIPFANQSITKVYSWQGPDNDFGFRLEDNVSTERDNRRVYNISNGKIYNEGHMWILNDLPMMGVNIDYILGYVSYRIGSYVNESEE